MAFLTPESYDIPIEDEPEVDFSDIDPRLPWMERAPRPALPRDSPKR
jgi:hypothetical protein